MALVGGLEFLRRTQPSADEATLEMKDLSSGEKVAFALALWTWGNSTRQITDILLIDEFDAHLNPSIAEKFITVIKEYFVDLGVQVIMTTHNPSTVVYARDAGADIIWMEDGVIDPEMSYEDIIKELSNGLIDVTHLGEKMELLIQNRERCTVYTEGTTDQKYLWDAIKTLGYREDFSNHFIFGCTSATTIPAFMKLPTGQSKRIALLDNDDTGKKTYDRIASDPDLKAQIDNGRLAVLFVSPNDGEETENLFDHNLRGSKAKTNFAKFMAKPENKTKENFAGFEILLNELLNAFEKTTSNQRPRSIRHSND